MIAVQAAPVGKQIIKCCLGFQLGLLWADTLNLIQQCVDNCISEAAGSLESPTPLLLASACGGML